MKNCDAFCALISKKISYEDNSCNRNCHYFKTYILDKDKCYVIYDYWTHKDNFPIINFCSLFYAELKNKQRCEDCFKYF